MQIMHEAGEFDTEPDPVARITREEIRIFWLLTRVLCGEQLGYTWYGPAREQGENKETDDERM
jgi:hypothetical protein